MSDEPVEVEPHKSEEMASIAIENGWEAVTTVDISEYEISENPFDIIWKLYAKRDLETLVVIWRGEVQIEAKYNYGDYWLFPAWRGGVLRLIKGKPDPKKLSSKDKGRPSDRIYEEILKEREVPWAHDDMPAFDILLAVLDKEIRWVHKGLFGVRERKEFCPKESNLGKESFKVHTATNGKRILNFANSFGFHACYIEDILEVS